MSSTETPKCTRCARSLYAEKPVLLPDAKSYCAACCESMAAGDFEMETGETFTKWIEKHPRLEMKYQPLEITVRRAGFMFPLVLSLMGLGIFIFAGIKLAMLFSAAPDWRSMLRLQGPAGYFIVGTSMLLFFGFLAARGAMAYLRAMNFALTLSNGVFVLRHGTRSETFHADDVVRACVVRPGTVGATEGALCLKDGRMLTLDTCLSDLHALGVVMDLRFREDFPPSADDLARIRRDKLRKIRGLS